MPTPEPASQADLEKYERNITAAQAALEQGKAAEAQGDGVSAAKYFALAKSYVVSYYSDQTSRGYAKDAQQVVQNVGVFGKVANQEVIDAIGMVRYLSLIPEIAVRLAQADLDILSDQHGVAPTENQISEYHYAVYEQLGIPLVNWGGSTGASLGADWSQGTLHASETDADLSLNKFFATFKERQTDTAFANLMAAGLRAVNRSPSLTGPSHWSDLLTGGFFGLNYTSLFDAKYGTQRMFVPTAYLADEGDRATAAFEAVRASSGPTGDPTTFHNLGTLSAEARGQMAVVAADPTDVGVTGDFTTVTMSDGKGFIAADSVARAMWSGWSVTDAGAVRDAAGATYEVVSASTATLLQLAVLDGMYAHLVTTTPALRGELDEASFFALMENPAFAYVTLADGTIAANNVYTKDPKTGGVSGSEKGAAMFYDSGLGMTDLGRDTVMTVESRTADGSANVVGSLPLQTSPGMTATFGTLRSIDPTAGTVRQPATVDYVTGAPTTASEPTVTKPDQGMEAVVVSLITPNAGQVTTSATSDGAGLFDVSADRTRTPVGWIGDGQALLVRDPYGTPVLDSNDVVRSMADLARYDANGDGLLEDSEADAAGVRLWFAAGGAPGTGSPVPATFARAGIQSIALSGTDDVAIDNGNALLGLHRVASADNPTASASDAYLATPTSTGTPLYYENGKAGVQRVPGLPQQLFVEASGDYARFVNGECVYDDAGGSTFHDQGPCQVKFTLGKGSTLELGNSVGDRVRMNGTGDTLKLDLVQDATGIGIRRSGNDVVLSETASHCNVTLVGLMSDAAAGWDPQGTISFAGGGSMSTAGIVAQLQRVAAARAGTQVASTSGDGRTTTSAALAAPADIQALARAIGGQGGAADASLPPPPLQAQVAWAKPHVEA